MFNFTFYKELIVFLFFVTMPRKKITKTDASADPKPKKESAAARMDRIESMLTALAKANPSLMPAALNTSGSVDDQGGESQEQEQLLKEQALEAEAKAKELALKQQQLVEARKRVLELEGDLGVEEFQPPPKVVKSGPSAAAGSQVQLDEGVDKDAVSLALNKLLGAEGVSEGEDIPNSYFIAGTVIDIKIKKKIWAREFIELGSLNKPEANGSSVNMAYSAGSMSQISFTPSKPRPPANIYEWVNLFSTFAAVYTQKYPQEAPQLFTYMQRVMSITRSHPASFIWRIYDERFRRLKQYSQSLPWHLLDHHILHEAQEVSSTTKNVQGQSKGKVLPQSVEVKTCFAFNKKIGCKKVNCPYKHICSKCRGSHPLYKCSRSGQGANSGSG